MTFDDISRSIDDLDATVRNLTEELKDINSNLFDIKWELGRMSQIEHTLDASTHVLIERFVSRLELL